MNAAAAPDRRSSGRPRLPRGLPPRSDILGTAISRTSYQQVLTLIDEPPPGRALTVAFCNVHTVMTARRDPRLRTALAATDVATPDGVPLVWFLRTRGHRTQERVYGPDLMDLALTHGVTRGWRHYFYGATAETLCALEQRVTARVPGVAIAGRHAPPFRPLRPDEQAAHAQAIRDSGATVVWVGLGMPKQEYWMARLAHQLPGTAVLAVGAAFDMHAGNVRQAPDWIQRMGMEWCYRLAQEPHRLWRRYAVNNPLFVLLWARALLTGSRRRRR